MKKSEVLILFLFALLFSLPLFFTVFSTFPRLDSDYDAVLPVYQYIGNFIRLNHTLPSTIPFVGAGIPVIGDPISGIYNPLLLIPIIFFNVNVSIRLTIFFVIFFSGLSQFIFLRKFKISKFLSFWGAMIFMTSGVLVAAVAAGHITEKFLTLPAIPLFLLAALKNQVSFKKSLFISLILSYALYSGDLYMAWFFSIFIFFLETYFFVKQRKFRLRRIIYFLTIPLFACIFSLPTLYPFLTHVLPIMKRPTLINPFLGSIHALFFPLQFLIPFQVNFYDRPFFQKHIGFYYNWYEYYAFLGFFPVIFFKNSRKIIANTYFQMCLVLFIIGGLYLACAFFYSPFHWLFVAWNNNAVFRVPQRIAIPLTPVVIFACCLLANTWKNKATLFFICFASLLWTFAIGWYTFFYTFVSLPKEEKTFIDVFSNIDKDRKPVVDFVGKTQFFLSEKNISVTNYYYAWVDKKTPTFSSDKGELYMDVLQKGNSLYVLTPRKISLEKIGYKNMYSDGKNIIWQKE